MTTDQVHGSNKQGENSWQGIHIVAKPIGPVCNLDCTYCYYLSKQELLGKPEEWRISDEVLETFIRQYFEGQNFKEESSRSTLQFRPITTSSTLTT